MLLVLERYDKNGRCAAVDDYHELYPHCLGEPLSAPYGIDPMFQFGTDLFVEAVAERQSEYYDPSDVNEAGVPYGFHHHRIAGFERHPGYPIVFDVNLLPERALDMLTYMKEGHYLDFESQRLTVQVGFGRMSVRCYLSNDNSDDNDDNPESARSCGGGCANSKASHV